MIDQLAMNTTKKMITNKIVLEKDYDVYVYGFQLMFSTILKSLGMLVIAFVLGVFKEAVVFYMTFAVLRVHAGGYHAENYLKCFITSSISFFTTIIIGIRFKEFFSLPIIAIMLAFSIIVVFKYAPVESLNKPLGINRREKFKNRSRKIVISESLIVLSILLINKSFDQYGILMALAVTLVALTSIPLKTIITNKKEGRPFI